MPRILFLTPQLPYPPQQGTSLRNWHILRGLAGRHQISLLSFTENDPSYVPAPLSALCERIETVPAPHRTTSQRLAQLVLTRTPDMAERLASEAFMAALRRRLQTERYDIVQVEGLEMAYLMPTIRDHSTAAIVLDCHNAETELQQRALATDSRQPRRWPVALYSRLQAGRLASYEQWALETADATIAVSQQDADLLQALVPLSTIPLAVIPNSIDVTEYSPSSAVPRPEQQFDLVFSGKMDYRPNVDAALWFADKVWTQLRSTQPGLTWGIVGQQPHSQLDRLRDMPGITLTGRVDRVQPYLTAAKVIIMPLRIGSGTRLKLIEAMAAGKAIVSTSIGSEGFPVISGEHLILADTPETQASALLHLLEDEAVRLQLGQSARRFAQAYDWRVVGPRFDSIYGVLLGDREV